MNAIIEQAKSPDFIIPIRYDFMFKSIFFTKDKRLLEYLLSDFLSDVLSYHDVKDNISFLNQDLEVYNKKEKKLRVDLVFAVNKIIVNIEMQNQLNDKLKELLLVYGAKIHGSQLDAGDDDYSDTGSFVQINFVNSFCNKHDLIEDYYLKNKHNETLSYNIRIMLVDIEKASKPCYNTDRCALWCKLINSSSYREIESIMKELKIDEKARQDYLKRMSMLSKEAKNFDSYINLSNDEIIALDNYQKYEESAVQIQKQKSEIKKQKAKLNEQKVQIDEQQAILKEQEVELEKQSSKLEEQEVQLEKQSNKLEEQEVQLEKQSTKLEEQSTMISEQKSILNKQAEEIAKLKKLLAEKGL